MNTKNSLTKVLGWIVTAILPFVILMLSIRMMITPLFAKIEYRMPGFPDDPYGFSLDDRLRWSEPAISYLVNKEDIGYLEELAFANGEAAFNQDELSHMVDVKNLVSAMRYALAGGMVVLLLITIILAVKNHPEEVRKAFYRGGWAVFILIAAILLFVVLSFSQLFTWFHQLFFESGTWMFYTSDTLIRLFPMRFWRDAFIIVGLLSAGFAAALVFSLKNKSK
jgi:integral membrane protein (TIGR01906 family)